MEHVAAPHLGLDDFVWLHPIVPPKILQPALERAAQLRVSVFDVLLEQGFLSSDDLYNALAKHWGLVFISCPPALETDRLEAALSSGLAIDQQRHFYFAPHHRQIERYLMRQPAAVFQGTQPLFLTTPRAFEKALFVGSADLVTHHVAYDLHQQTPLLSARLDAGLRPYGWLVGLEILALLLCFVSLTAGVAVITGLLTSIIFLWTLFRFAAVLAGDHDPVRLPSQPDANLPVYTVLVALYREANVVPDLVASLERLDWPLAKLDILFLTEADDEETRQALESHISPAFMRVITVPDGQPRTKPRALNAGLLLAKGDYLVIYDAEDRPDPFQLRQAFATFSCCDEDVACLQARLTIDNARDSLLSRLFWLEYLALFHCLLPGLWRFGAPLPLGGTSNHFRVRTLRDVVGWDAWNVTEDADLGFRLARAGYRCLTLRSETFEEAPHQFWPWFRQRTRWMKGWIQTYLVHMRHPFSTLRSMGFLPFVGLQALMAGSLLSPLLYPAALFLLILQIFFGRFLVIDPTLSSAFLMSLDLMVLFAGTLGGLLPLMVVVVRYRRWGALPLLLAVPFYWLLISAAAWRAVWQFITNPYLWEKTDHGTAKSRHAAPH